VGWKRYLLQLLINLFIVEREPMWDGNITSILHHFKPPKLSENQCGMETCFSLTRMLPDPLLSENQCGMETVLPDELPADSLVEREPMWDGNSTAG